MTTPNLFSTTVQHTAFFKLPDNKMPTNKYLKKKDEDKPLSEKILRKVFSEFSQEKENNDNKKKPMR